MRRWHRITPGAQLRPWPSVSRGWLVLLALVLLCMQSIGQWHGVVHGDRLLGAPDRAPVVQALAGLEEMADRAAQPHAGHGLEALFGTHKEGPDCQMFEGLLQAAPVLLAPLLVLSPGTAALQPPQSDRSVAPRRVSLFDARGPPISR